MKINIINKSKISCHQADILIDKYYNGKTTCREEEILSHFLNQKGIPARYETEKAILGYLSTQRNRSNSPNKSIRYRRIAAAATIILAFGLGFYQYNKTKYTSIAYIDGHKITDKEIIKSLAKNTLNSVLAENYLVEEHLDRFSDIEFKKK